MQWPVIDSAQALAQLVDQVGFLPFFKGKIPGFSIAEFTPPDLWFSDAEGPWEWKGPVIQQTGCAYGKFFHGKAGYVSREWFPDFANYRRDGYDFDAAYDDGLASFVEKRIYDTLAPQESMLSRHLRSASGLVGENRHGFDATLARLQGRCYIVTVNFEYALDRHGKPYGWGLARYATPEQRYGTAFSEQVYQRKPEESAQRILEHLAKLLPQATPAQLKYLLG